jgi:hypothetical protein
MATWWRLTLSPVEKEYQHMENLSDTSLDAAAVESYAADASETLGRSSTLQEVPSDLLREVAGALLEAQAAL